MDPSKTIGGKVYPPPKHQYLSSGKRIKRCRIKTLIASIH